MKILLLYSHAFSKFKLQKAWKALVKPQPQHSTLKTFFQMQIGLSLYLINKLATTYAKTGNKITKINFVFWIIFLFIIN